MRTCPVCKQNFNSQSKDQIFCGGGHCSQESGERSTVSSTTQCPYCSQAVFPSAVLCGACGGILSIGSLLAIKHALASDPTLALKDALTIERLKEFVNKIDASLMQEEAEKSRFQAEVEAEIRALEIEDERLWNEHLGQLSPTARFLEVRAKEIKIISILLISLCLVAAYFSYNEKNSIERWCEANYPISSDFYINLSCLDGHEEAKRYFEANKLRKSIIEEEGVGKYSVYSFCADQRNDQSYIQKIYDATGDPPSSSMSLAFVEGCSRYFGLEGTRTDDFKRIYND